jgi:hypothetical protein
VYFYSHQQSKSIKFVIARRGCDAAIHTSSLRGGEADAAIQYGVDGSPRAFGPRDDSVEGGRVLKMALVVRVLRDRRRGNPQPRHCEEAKLTRQSSTAVLMDRHGPSALAMTVLRVALVMRVLRDRRRGNHNLRHCEEGS